MTWTTAVPLLVVLSVAGCHRDLTIPRNCENTPSLCDVTDSAVGEVESVDADADFDGAAVDARIDGDDTAPMDDAPVDAAPDGCATPCAAGEICSGAVCSPPSCAGGLTCAGGVSCCESKPVPAGTVPMGRATTGPENDVCTTWTDVVCAAWEQPQHSATVSAFRLDTFEVTVGRFRKFVDGYPGSKPAAGAGAHPAIAGSGWNAAWDSALPATAAELKESLRCRPSYETWTDVAADNENKPLSCVKWYLAFAFCAWDGGRLPTEAEWEYAAAGGSENRVMPWGNSAPTPILAIYGCDWSACNASSVPPVGSKPSGAARWGQQDLAGSLGEWVLDAFGAYSTLPTTDFAQLSGPGRVWRGGSRYHNSGELRNVVRKDYLPDSALDAVSFRCARRP